MTEADRTFRIFIGYDDRQAVAYTALQQSILETASCPVSITPLMLHTLPINRRGLTPFTYSRFLVPWLCDYEGFGLFLDADMFLVSDIAELYSNFNPDYAVSVVRSIAQFEQSSVLLFNNSHPSNRQLTPEFVEHTEQNLLGLEWAGPENIGELDAKWNQLVGYQECSDASGNLHFTMGVPAFPETSTSPFIDQWTDCAKRAIGVTQSWGEIMGPSVHAIKINDHFFPKYVWNQETQWLHNEHKQLVETLVNQKTK